MELMGDAPVTSVKVCTFSLAEDLALEVLKKYYILQLIK